MSFRGQSQRDAVEVIRRAVAERHVFVALTGAPALGKTTLLNASLATVPGGPPRIVRICEPDCVSRALAVEIEGVAVEWAARPAEDHQHMVLVVDDAHSASAELLRALTRIAVAGRSNLRLPQVILAGNPELWDRLADAEFAPLAERIVVRPVLLLAEQIEIDPVARPMSDGDLKAYVERLAHGNSEYLASIAESTLTSAIPSGATRPRPNPPRPVARSKPPARKGRAQIARNHAGHRALVLSIVLLAAATGALSVALRNWQPARGPVRVSNPANQFARRDAPASRIDLAPPAVVTEAAPDRARAAASPVPAAEQLPAPAAQESPPPTLLAAAQPVAQSPVAAEQPPPQSAPATPAPMERGNRPPVAPATRAGPAPAVAIAEASPDGARAAAAPVPAVEPSPEPTAPESPPPAPLTAAQPVARSPVTADRPLPPQAPATPAPIENSERPPVASATRTDPAPTIAIVEAPPPVPATEQSRGPPAQEPPPPAPLAAAQPVARSPVAADRPMPPQAPATPTPAESGDLPLVAASTRTDPAPAVAIAAVPPPVPAIEQSREPPAQESPPPTPLAAAQPVARSPVIPDRPLPPQAPAARATVENSERPPVASATRTDPAPAIAIVEAPAPVPATEQSRGPPAQEPPPPAPLAAAQPVARSPVAADRPMPPQAPEPIERGDLPPVAPATPAVAIAAAPPTHVHVAAAPAPAIEPSPEPTPQASSPPAPLAAAQPAARSPVAADQPAPPPAPATLAPFEGDDRPLVAATDIPAQAAIVPPPEPRASAREAGVPSSDAIAPPPDTVASALPPIPHRPPAAPSLISDAEGLPLAAPARVLLRYPRASADGAGQVASLAQALRAAGFTVVASAALPRRDEKPGARYFFTEDRDTAAAVLKAAGLPGKGTLAEAARLEAPPRPGMIELVVVRGGAEAGSRGEPSSPGHP